VARHKMPVHSALLIKEIRTPREVFRDLRNYLAGQVLGATRDDTLLDELLKCLFCKLYVERGLAAAIPSGSDSFSQAQYVRSVFSRVRADFPDIYPSDTEMLLDPEAIRTVFEACAFSLLDASSDPIGDAFEVFVGSESRGRSGQFFTPRSVTDFLVEAVDPQPGELVIDPACGAGGFLASVARHYLANGSQPEELASLSARTFYGIDKDDYLAKLARVHIALLTGGRPRVHCADSIAMENESPRFREEVPQGGFDVLLTNPPFGAKIVAARPEVLRKFELARRWCRDADEDRWYPTTELRSQVPPQVLFVERCLSLLRHSGRLGMVLPESVLSNKSYRHVVEFLKTHASVQGVIGMPDALFKTSGKGGTHTKTCLLLATKCGDGKRRDGALFMAEAKWCGNDSRGRAIANNDLPTIAANLKTYRKNKPLVSSRLGFVLDRAELSSNVLCPRYYDPQLAREIEALRGTHHLYMFGDLAKEGVLKVATGDELGKLAYGTGDIPFIRTSDFSNWELKADPKHGVDRKIFEAIRRKQDVQLNDLLMVRDGTYLIGTCALITALDTEIIYQSHIYKIRVLKNAKGINPFLLLAVFTCPLVQRQIRSKQFTHDIIDSIGDRVNEIILPVPKAAKTRERITKMVKNAISRREQARELAKQARLSVVASPDAC